METDELQSTNPAPTGAQQIIVSHQYVERKSNNLGVAGFTLALLGLFLFWVPVLDWVLWAFGLIFSSWGMFKNPKGLAIAGLILSVLTLIALIFATKMLAPLYKVAGYLL